MAEETPPILQGPSSKEKKYDRQLRLWAASGQAALEEAHILLINSGPGVAGIETLKNLVLPCIGQFTILDSAIVSEADLGVNFFLDESTLGGFRAELTCNLLKELNPDVQGHSISEPLESFINKPKALDPYTLIIVAAPVDPAILRKIAQHAQDTSIPTFYLHSVGFYSHFSVYLPHSFPIVDTHPDPVSTTDLRLLSPWPALTQFAQEKTKDLDKMNDHDHGHVPYLLLLLHYLEIWKQEHGGKAPENYKDKSAFREIVSTATRRGNPEGSEENFDEAVAAVLKSLNPPSPSNAVREVFNAPECAELGPGSPSFWVIASALSTFVKQHGVLPVPGAVPDMKAQSADYIALQNVYKTKAREDVAEVLATVRDTEKSLGRIQQIEEKEVEAFCKGAAHIKLVRGRPLQIVSGGESPTVKFGETAQTLSFALENPDSLISHYIAFQAFDKFCATHSEDGLQQAPRVPGEKEDEVEADVEKMSGIAHKIVDDLLKEADRFIEDPEYSGIKARIGQVCEEITRAGGAELHNIAAVAGGLVAQEVIKAITKQYIPVDNTCIFDGIVSKTSVLRI